MTASENDEHINELDIHDIVNTAAHMAADVLASADDSERPVLLNELDAGLKPADVRVVDTRSPDLPKAMPSATQRRRTREQVVHDQQIIHKLGSKAAAQIFVHRIMKDRQQNMNESRPQFDK